VSEPNIKERGGYTSWSEGQKPNKLLWLDMAHGTRLIRLYELCREREREKGERQGEGEGEGLTCVWLSNMVFVQTTFVCTYACKYT
jgi:hypothetical protein